MIMSRLISMLAMEILRRFLKLKLLQSIVASCHNRSSTGLEWATIHRSELRMDWEYARKGESLKSIAPLD